MVIVQLNGDNVVVMDGLVQLVVNLVVLVNHLMLGILNVLKLYDLLDLFRVLGYSRLRGSGGVNLETVNIIYTLFCKYTTNLAF